MSESGNGKRNGAPWWVSTLAQSGTVGVILAAVLGLVPGVQSPIERWLETTMAHHIEETKATYVLLERRNNQLMQEVVRLRASIVMLCYGVWKDRLDLARYCGQPELDRYDQHN